MGHYHEQYEYDEHVRREARKANIKERADALLKILQTVGFGAHGSAINDLEDLAGDYLFKAHIILQQISK